MLLSCENMADFNFPMNMIFAFVATSARILLKHNAIKVMRVTTPIP